MVQRVNQTFILSFLLTDVIKEHEDLCANCRKNTKNLNSNIFKIKNGRLIMQSRCADCGIKKSIFVKEQGAKELLSNLGLKTRLSKITLLGDVFIECIK